MNKIYKINKYHTITMFTTKYRPTNLSNFIGNKRAIQPFIKWLLEWDGTNKKTKCALISGVNGIGKSLLVNLMLEKHDYHMIHISIDDERDKDYMINTIKPLLRANRTFTGQENVLVVSDIDSSGGDYGFISSLVECIKETKIPIICICDDRYCQNIKPILAYCFDIKMSKPSYTDVYPLIYKVVTTEKIKISKSKVDKLYEQSNGDIRYILNALQLGNIDKCDMRKNIQSSNIFDTAGTLFNMDTELNDKYNIYWMAHDIHPLLVHENYIASTLNVRDEVKKLENISYSANSLSDMDLIDAPFDFDLSPYVAFNTIKATTKCNKKGQIKFPQFLGKISTANKNKREKLDYTQVKFKIK
jgi:replication factor C subunit 1